MLENRSHEKSALAARGSRWAASVFYILIAFEFFYMASPFAAFFYSVYGPGLDFLEGSPITRWSIRFFLPHIVEETSSPLIGAIEKIGVVLFLGGLLGFAVGAFQIYRAKLRRDNAVMGGLYRVIRHPQYLALIVASIGMLLIWPRFLVLIGTVTVIFVYVALAKTEEGICMRQYPDYSAYKARTGMFLPRLFGLRWSLRLGEGRLVRFGVWLGAYLLTLLLAVAVADWVRGYAISRMYQITTDNAVYLSVVRMSPAELAAVARIASQAPAAVEAMSAAGKDARFLNYVLPAEMYVAEIPMSLKDGARFGHSVPRDRHAAKYKVIFTEADFGGGPPAAKDILRRAVSKRPLIEIRLDLDKGAVEESLAPPDAPFYGDHQVPLF